MDSTLGANWRTQVIQEALTFDDILMVPVHSSIASRSDCVLTTKFSKNVPLKIPLVSSPMDTVTEYQVRILFNNYQMAVCMAQQGGLGIIHRYLSIEEQADMVRKVKRQDGLYNTRPYLIGVGCTMKRVKSLMNDLGIKTFLVTDDSAIPPNYNFDTQNKQRLRLETGSSPRRKSSDL